MDLTHKLATLDPPGFNDMRPNRAFHRHGLALDIGLEKVAGYFEKSYIKTHSKAIYIYISYICILYVHMSYIYIFIDIYVYI